MKGLEQDRFARVVTGKLPEAEFAFIDEIFKANSAILNSMLTLVNERIFHNDGKPVTCPLITLFGASNELPEGKDLETLFDRFLVRFEVGYLLRPANLKLVLTSPEPGVAPAISLADLKKMQAEVAKVTVTDDTVEGLTWFPAPFRRRDPNFLRRLEEALAMTDQRDYRLRVPGLALDSRCSRRDLRACSGP